MILPPSYTENPMFSTQLQSQVLPPHKHLVQFHGACMDEVPPMLVMEFLAGGDLRGALSNSQLAPALTWYRYSHAG